MTEPKDVEPLPCKLCRQLPRPNSLERTPYCRDTLFYPACDCFGFCEQRIRLGDWNSLHDIISAEIEKCELAIAREAFEAGKLLCAAQEGNCNCDWEDFETWKRSTEAAA